MKKPFILLVNLLFCFYSFAQTEKVVCTVNIPVKSILTDRLDRIYVVNNTGLFQFDRIGKQTAAFTQLLTGGITSVDVSNPLKVMVFVQAEQKIYFLNDRLHVQSSISLSDVGILQAVVACNSRSEGFRIYDRASQKLVRFDYNLNRLQENELSLYPVNVLDPGQMAENENGIVIANRDSGIMVLDRFGNYLRMYELRIPSGFYLNESEIIYQEGNQLIFLSMNNSAVKKQEAIHPTKPFAIKNNNRWIFYDSTGFMVVE